jgi:hypothetical protein
VKDLKDVLKDVPFHEMEETPVSNMAHIGNRRFPVYPADSKGDRKEDSDWTNSLDQENYDW